LNFAESNTAFQAIFNQIPPQQTPNQTLNQKSNLKQPLQSGEGTTIYTLFLKAKSQPQPVPNQKGTLNRRAEKTIANLIGCYC
jgi:hypothetical protein